METIKKDTRGFFVERMFHYFVMGFTGFLILFGFWFAYQGLNGTYIQKPEMPEMNSDVGQRKALPDFMLENIKPDDLEQLKQ